MSQLINAQSDQIQDFFEEAENPHIFSRNQEHTLCLNTLTPNTISMQQSIKAIEGVVDAIVYLKMNMFMPTQIKFQYVVKCKGVWGINHVICNRSEEKSLSQEEKDAYNPEEFLYHRDAESELVWNIGKIWLRFFTNKPIIIKNMKQQVINNFIDKTFNDLELRVLLKKMLMCEYKMRIQFEDLVGHQVLIQEEENLILSSIVQHINKVSRIFQRSSGHKGPRDNSFAREIKYRFFKEYLDIDTHLIEKVRTEIKSEFAVEGQENATQFILYIILLQDYLTMIRLSEEIIQMGDKFDKNQDRRYYAKFVKRMIIIKETLDKKMKILKNRNLKLTLTKYLVDANTITPELVGAEFKICLSEYIDSLQRDLRRTGDDLPTWRLLIKLFLTRTSAYVFSEARAEVFRDFTTNGKCFNLKETLNKIYEEKDINKLKNLFNLIHKAYF